MALSVDSVEKGQSLQKRLSIQLPIYSDEGGAAARGWQVWDAEHKIARTASFVVAPGGTIIFRYLGQSKSDRPSVANLIQAIDAHLAATR